VWCNCGVDYKRALRLVGDGQRVLTEGNARIERQRAIIAKLERLGINSDKETQFLTRLIETHQQQAQLVAEALERVQGNPFPHNRRSATPQYSYTQTGAG
jgi:hypothetical protein